MQAQNGRTEQSMRGAEMADTPYKCQPFPAPLHSRNRCVAVWNALSKLMLPSSGVVNNTLFYNHNNASIGRRFFASALSEDVLNII